MELALILAHDHRTDLDAPGRGLASLARQKKRLVKPRLKAAQNLFLQPMGEKAGEQILGQGWWRHIFRL